MPEADSEVPSFISTSLLIGYPDRSVTPLSLSFSLRRFITSGGNASYVRTRKRSKRLITLHRIISSVKLNPNPNGYE